MPNWFEVDKEGLAKLVERRGKQFIIYELVQNAIDQNVRQVVILLDKHAGERSATITVEDDDPEGFRDISHAFTLFAPSTKKGDPEKRGRFNLGEKLILALCSDASITTTTGGLRFDADGRHVLRRKRERGSVFSGKVRMTNAEFEACVESVAQLILPPHVEVFFFVNDAPVTLEPRVPIAQVSVSLPTEIADDEGVMRRTSRNTLLRIYEPRDGEVGTLYEMGIPVVETGDTYHIDVAQKVPLNMERDNVTPAYLRAVRTAALNAMHDKIDTRDVNQPWVRDALADTRITPDAVRTVVQLKFGEKAVAYDPSDPEANKRVVAAGYVVVHGAQLSKEEWANIREADALPPAGHVMPTPKPYSNDLTAPPVTVIAWEDMTDGEQGVVIAYRKLSKLLLGFEPEIRIVDADSNFNAAYGKGGPLDLNRNPRRLGRFFFDECLAGEQLTERAISLLIHELGHEYCGDHLSSDYYRALTTLGAKLALLVAKHGPELLEVKV